VIKCETEFENFYEVSGYDSWQESDAILTKKTVLWQVWSKAWQEAYREGREELAASLVSDLHQHMGNKKVIVFEDWTIDEKVEGK
jgi:hypothetical protein